MFVGTDVACVKGGFHATNNGANVNVAPMIGLISDSGRDDEEKDGKVLNHGQIVRQAQESYVTNDPRAALVTSTDAYGYSDPWHYDSAGYFDLGTQFAIAVHNLHQADRRSAAGDTGP